MSLKYAYGYVRVSTDRQEELSPDSQEKLLREYAKNNNIVILKVFYELGISGRKADKRPAFQEMISLCKSDEHPADIILVWKYSRFARNQEESIVYKSLLKKQCNVEVVSVSEPLVDGPFGSLIERIIEWMDEYYSIRLSGEVLRGMEEKAHQEGYQMVPPLGYQAVGHGKPFIINEEEYQIIDYITRQFDTYDKDYTAIARQLNDMGYLTRRGRPFETRTIERILTNPFYYGLVVWNGISFTGSHETRITKECYDKRMQKIQQRHQPAKRRNVSACKHWLSGLIKCGYCGATLTYSGANSKCPFFQCYRYSKGAHKNSCSISEKKIIETIYEYFEKLLGGMDFEYAYHAPQSSELISKQDSLLRELDKLASRERRIHLAYENGIDTLEEYGENKKRLKKAREDLEQELAGLTPQSSESGPTKQDVLSKIKTVYDIIRNPEIDYPTKGNVMRGLVEDIIYDKENGKLIFHLYIS